ncbi:hypothetical protein A5865_002951, partial [Enterococcus sp. 12E11_DIV0728]
ILYRVITKSVTYLIGKVFNYGRKCQT